MTNDDIRIDPDLLEDGEHVLWAVGDLTPKREWKYAAWGGILFVLLFGIYEIYASAQAWEFFKNGWQNPKVLWMVIWGISASAIVWAANLWAKRKGISPEQQSEYYVGLITNQRLVLYSADRAPEIVIRPGEVTGIKQDYSNGAPALKLDLKAGAPLSSVTIVTSADLTKAKMLIENGFMVSGKNQNQNGALA